MLSFPPTPTKSVPTADTANLSQHYCPLGFQSFSTETSRSSHPSLESALEMRKPFVNLDPPWLKRQCGQLHIIRFPSSPT